MAASSPASVPAGAPSDFINDVLTRITLVGAIYLVIVSADPDDADQRHPLQPSLADRARSSTRLPTWMTNGLGVNFYFGGTSLLIVVGVAMDTVQQVESQLIMRHYDGFSPKSGRIRGRRSW